MNAWAMEWGQAPDPADNHAPCTPSLWRAVGRRHEAKQSNEQRMRGWDEPSSTGKRPSNRASKRGKVLQQGQIGGWTACQTLTLRVRSWWATSGCRPDPLTRRTGHSALPLSRESKRPTSRTTVLPRLTGQMRPQAPSAARRPPTWNVGVFGEHVPGIVGDGSARCGWCPA
jgi:hypothetical protein